MGAALTVAVVANRKAGSSHVLAKRAWASSREILPWMWRCCVGVNFGNAVKWITHFKPYLYWLRQLEFSLISVEVTGFRRGRHWFQVLTPPSSSTKLLLPHKIPQNLKLLQFLWSTQVQTLSDCQFSSYLTARSEFLCGVRAPCVFNYPNPSNHMDRWSKKLNSTKWK